MEWCSQCVPTADVGRHLGFAVRLSDPAFDALVLRTGSDANERIYGMGQQFPHADLNLKGRTIPVLVQEGGVGRGHPIITPAVNLVSSGSGGAEETTYYVAPHYLTSRDRSLVLEGTHYAEFDFTADDHIAHHHFAGALDGRVVYGADPLDLIEAFTAWAGRMPPPPAWIDAGAIVALARPLDDGRQIVDELREAGAAIAGVWNQTWSGINVTFIGEQVLWNWVQNPNDHPGWDAWVAGLEADGMRALCYVNPMFLDVPEDAQPVRRNLYAEGVEGGFFGRDHEGEVFLQPVTAFEVALLDLSNPDARDWMKAIIREELIERAGCSGWMADFAEALPFEAVLDSGESAAEWHNRYPVEWMKLNREAIEDGRHAG